VYIERCPAIRNKISRNLEKLGVPLKISFDIDGVVQATFQQALLWASHRLKNSIDLEQLVTYWGLNEISRKFRLSEKDAHDSTRNAFNREEVFLNSPPLPGARSILGIFQELGIPYVFISSRPADFLEATGNWFAKEFPWIDRNNIFLRREEGESGGSFKSRVIVSQGVLLHFDDSMEDAQEIVRRTQAKIVIVPQPRNRYITLEPEEHSTRILNLRFNSKKTNLWAAMEFLTSDCFLTSPDI